MRKKERLKKMKTEILEYFRLKKVESDLISVLNEDDIDEYKALPLREKSYCLKLMWDLYKINLEIRRLELLYFSETPVSSNEYVNYDRRVGKLLREKGIYNFEQFLKMGNHDLVMIDPLLPGVYRKLELKRKLEKELLEIFYKDNDKKLI